MSDYQQITCGYSVEANRKAFSTQEIVTLHKLGSSERGYFTPDEARALSNALLRAASAAEAKP
jgi:hypothetical protein